jgi:hypothetical protein
MHETDAGLLVSHFLDFNITPDRFPVQFPGWLPVAPVISCPLTGCLSLVACRLTGRLSVLPPPDLLPKKNFMHIL